MQLLQGVVLARCRFGSSALFGYLDLVAQHARIGCCAHHAHVGRQSRDGYFLGLHFAEQVLQRGRVECRMLELENPQVFGRWGVQLRHLAAQTSAGRENVAEVYAAHAAFRIAVPDPGNSMHCLHGAGQQGLSRGGVQRVDHSCRKQYFGALWHGRAPQQACACHCGCQPAWAVCCGSRAVDLAW